jgi:hypothetical protein
MAYELVILSTSNLVYVENHPTIAAAVAEIDHLSPFCKAGDAAEIFDSETGESVLIFVKNTHF